MNGMAIKFPDIALSKEAINQLVAGNMEKLLNEQRILICDRKRFDPAQTADPNVGAPCDSPLGISLPSEPLGSLLKKLSSVLRSAHLAG